MYIVYILVPFVYRGWCICAAVKAARDFSSAQFVKISNTRVERTTIVSSTNASVIDVRHVATSAAYKLE